MDKVLQDINFSASQNTKFELGKLANIWRNNVCIAIFSLQKMSVDNRHRRCFFIFFIYLREQKNSSFGKNRRKLCTLKMSPCHVSAIIVWSFWYCWNDFLIKITRFFRVAMITFLLSNKYFLASVLRQKSCGGHKNLSQNHRALKNILNVRNFRFRFFVKRVKNARPIMSSQHRNNAQQLCCYSLVFLNLCKLSFRVKYPRIVFNTYLYLEQIFGINM